MKKVTRAKKKQIYGDKPSSKSRYEEKKIAQRLGRFSTGSPFEVTASGETIEEIISTDIELRREDDAR